MLSHVKSQSLVRGEELAAHVAGKLEEVDVLLLPMLVVHCLSRETALTHVTRINAETYVRQSTYNRSKYATKLQIKTNFRSYWRLF